jgi:hypothetical protein
MSVKQSVIMRAGEGISIGGNELMTIKTTRIKRITSIAVIVVFALALFMSTATPVSAVTTKTQTAWSLDPSDYTSVVKNNNFFVKAYTYQHGKLTSTNTIKTSKKDKKAVTFKTKYFLPYSYVSNRWLNPQSTVMDPDTGYLYVLYTKEGGSNQGWIVRYDTKKLAKYKISKTQLKAATKSGTSALNKKIKKCIKYGPIFTTGHGQSLSLNPVTGELWEIKDTSMKAGKGSYATLQRINKNTLKPNAAIKFRLKSTYAMGHNLTFDSEGNAYFFTYTSTFGNSLKIFRGQISTDSVHFEVIPQGLKNPPGTHSQGIAYSAKSNRLLFIADGCISSVPVDKLGNLKAADVWQTKFKTKREFESVTFDEKGYAYLLVNRNPEVLKSTTVY